MFQLLCNEIKYCIIKFVIFSDKNNVLRLRKVDSYFKFVVDEELFSVISNTVERVHLFGRNYFSNITQIIGELHWNPRKNQLSLNFTKVCDTIESEFYLFSTRIYNGFNYKLNANNNKSMNRSQFFNQIQNIFHPIDEYSKRLKFAYQHWKETIMKTDIQFFHQQKKGYIFPSHFHHDITCLDWSFRVGMMFGIGDDPLFYPFIDSTLLAKRKHREEKRNLFEIMPTILFGSDLFSSLLKPKVMQLTTFSTIFDFHPTLIHLISQLNPTNSINF